MDNTTSKKTLGIITIATGRYYDEFIPTLKKSVDTYLHHPELEVHFYCFTDSDQQTAGVHHFPIKHMAWPFSTLMRFHWIKEQMGIAGLERVRAHFTLERQVKKYQEWYEEIVSKQVSTHKKLYLQ
jgi:hypothetical protein